MISRLIILLLIVVDLTVNQRGCEKLLSTKSYKNKFNNLEFTIYLDIGISLLLLLILIISLIPNSFNIIPIKVVKPFLGINNLLDIFKLLHYILIGVTITFIVQSILLLLEYRFEKIESSSLSSYYFINGYYLLLLVQCLIYLILIYPPFFLS